MTQQEKKPPVNFKVEAWVPIADLKEHPKNPRVDLINSPERFESLKRSIQEGVFEPIKVSKLSGYCIAGNQRIKAFRSLSYTHVPVQYNEYEKEADEIRDMIKDNNEWGAYDYDNLNQLMEVTDGLEALSLGFNDLDFKMLDKAKAEASKNEGKEDDVPEIPTNPVSKEGDIYKLGSHVLICGDSTDHATIESLMLKGGGNSADMVFTDPPYNVNYSGRGKKTSTKIENDNMDKNDFLEFLLDSFSAIRKNVKKTASAYVFHGFSSQIPFQKALEISGFKIKNQIIWKKPTASMGWGNYRWQHEPLFYCCVGDEKTNFYGDRTHSTVWDFQGNEESLYQWAKDVLKAEKEGRTTIWSVARENVAGYIHPTQKPVQLIFYALRNSSKEGDIVLDPFGGSGATMIACEKMKRQCRMAENDPRFVDVIIARFEAYTGLKAQKLN